MTEAEQVRARYARRTEQQLEKRYLETSPLNLKIVQERERALVGLLNRHLNMPTSAASAIEVGCGSGSNLATLIRFGFTPQNLVANELLEDRVEQARNRLPSSVQILPGDATQLAIPQASFDIVYQSTVFSSLLQDDTQESLAAAMWSWLKPGGGIVWYDFTYNNPMNQDVRGVPMKRIRELFPNAVIDAHRITLAPPIARRIPQQLYGLVNIRPLRTHVLCWLAKPLQTG